LENSRVFADQFQGLIEAWREQEGFGMQVWEIFYLSQESGGGLDGKACGGVASGKRGLAQVGYAGETFGYAAGE
jgi:hypothetical protein